MANPRIIIAGGCSFTQVPSNEYNWPWFLSSALNSSAFYLGTGCSDNNLIANKVLNKLSEIQKSKQYKNEDLLVGVMWSGVSRNTIYLQEPPISYTKIETNESNINHLSENQHTGNPNRTSHLRHYYMIAPHFQDQLAQLYYKHFYDDIGGIIQSLKNMLLVQNFCKMNNIKYFFTEYSTDTVTNLDVKDHIDVKFLYDMVDFNEFLPIKNMFDWCKNESGLRHRPNDDHPTSQMSKKFTLEVIIPYLKKKGYIN